LSDVDEEGPYDSRISDKR